MQSFLGFVNVYGKYIVDSTLFTSALYDLTANRKGEDTIRMFSEDVKSFEEIKKRLCAGPRFAHFDLEQPFVLYTNASKIAVGAAFLQRDSNGVERAVSFFSKKLSLAQRNYSTIERKCLAVICALDHVHVYLLGRRFHLRTDPRALAWLFSKEPKASARISGWLATLMEYPIAIEDVRGAEITIADAFSRFDSVAIDNEVPAELAQRFPSFASPVSDSDCFDARTDWIFEQQSDGTIAYANSPLNRKSRSDPTNL